MRIAVIGGDVRSQHLADWYEKEGVEVRRFAQPSGNAHTLEAALHDADWVIGPTPFLRGGALNAPFAQSPIAMDELLLHIPRSAALVAGAIPGEIRSRMDASGLLWHDLMDDEQLTLDNAIPSAEGAIQLALERMDVTLSGSMALVLGYGRIGKALTGMLLGMGAKAHVFARRTDALALARLAGATPVSESQLLEALGKMDVVLNTIPAMVLGQTRLARTKPSVEIIDLASAPGGVDFQAAKVLRRSANLDLGLPGKVAPRSAAQYMKQAIDRLLNREICK